MADVNGFKMDDIIDAIADGLIRIEVAEVFAIIKSAPRQKGLRTKTELLELLSGDNW